MAKKINLPQEGDMLFEKKRFLQSTAPFSWVVGCFSIFMVIAYISVLILDGSHLLDWITFTIFGVLSLSFILMLIDGFRYGFEDETYKGYYFHDRLVFHRISYRTNEFALLFSKSLAELMNWEPVQDDSKKEIKKRKKDFKKPFNLECIFYDLKYIYNKNDEITIISKEEGADDADVSNFLHELQLAPKYKKYASEIVAFLNERIKQATADPNAE